MSQYTFTELNRSIFENSSRPQLVYLQQIGGDTPVTPRALHMHADFAELFFVLQGSCSCSLAGAEYKITQGDLMLVNSHTLYSTSNETSTDYAARLIAIKSLHMKGLERNQLISPKLSPIVPSGDMFHLLALYIKTIENLAPQGETERASQAAHHILNALLYTLQDMIQNHTTLQKGQDYNLGLQIKEYIDEHYAENLKLSDIAQALHANSYYISHTFKKILGYSPIQYLTNRRIGEAQNLLLSTNLTVTEIAMHCGYNNSNYFQVVFNNIVGMPPGKYRKAWRQ